MLSGDFAVVLRIGHAITISHTLTLVLVQGKRIKIIKYIHWEDVEEPFSGDTIGSGQKYGLFGDEAKSVSYQLNILLLHLLREETLTDAGFPLR